MKEGAKREIDRAKIGLFVVVVALLFSTILLYTDYLRLRTERDYLMDLLDKFKRVPSGYYQTDLFKDRDRLELSQLENFLASEFKLPKGFKGKEFDCSESVAYMEWALEDAGFDAWIVVGETPWNPGIGYHAWVIAYTEEISGTKVLHRIYAIEPTAFTGQLSPHMHYLLSRKVPGIIYTGDRYADGYYFGYDKSYKNIYWAIEDYGDVKEWDWWVFCQGFPPQV